MNKQITKTIFGLVVAIHILSILLGWDQLSFWTKPLLMISLASYFHYSVERNNFTFWIMMAIIFSFGGDVLLMFVPQAAIYFVFGLGSFLIAHLCYSYGMVKFPNFNQGILKKQWWWNLPFLIYGGILLSFLWSGLDEMTIPVAIYSIIIMLMGISAVNMSGRTSKEAAIYIIIGAILFILSDSVIALNKFKSTQLSIPNSGFIIMTTYILGQFLIVEGIIKAVNFQKGK